MSWKKRFDDNTWQAREVCTAITDIWYCSKTHNTKDAPDSHIDIIEKNFKYLQEVASSEKRDKFFLRMRWSWRKDFFVELQYLIDVLNVAFAMEEGYETLDAFDSLISASFFVSDPVYTKLREAYGDEFDSLDWDCRRFRPANTI